MRCVTASMAARAYKARANPSRNHPSSLFRVARTHWPHAEPTSNACPSASSSGLRGFPEHQCCIKDTLSERDSAQSARGSRHRRIAARTGSDEKSLRWNHVPSHRAADRDSSHYKRVSSIKFFRAYPVELQCVAVDDGSRLDTEAGTGHRRLDPRGHDNGKPVERPGRKATRLTRKESRHASRATERSSRRGT